MFCRAGRKGFAGRVENVSPDGCREFTRIFGDFGASGLSWATQLPALASFIQRNHMDQVKEKKLFYGKLFMLFGGIFLQHTWKFFLVVWYSLFLKWYWSKMFFSFSKFFRLNKNFSKTNDNNRIQATIIIFITATNVCIMIIVTQCL